MWLLSWIQDNKQQKFLFQELSTLAEYTKGFTIGFFVEKVVVFVPKDSKAPPKESDSYRRLVPLSDTTYKEEK